MHIYEYLFAGVIIIALLIGSTVMVTTLATPAANASDKDQLKVTAEKVMTQMLLDSGYPNNWGSNKTPVGDLKVFGLAEYGLTSRQAYELDPDKVLRLSSSIGGDASYYIPPTGSPNSAINLLNLVNDQGAAEYGFTLEFSSTLQISASYASASGYSITVSSEYNLPVIGAEMSATLYYINAAGQIASQGPSYGTTGSDGSYSLPFNYNPSVDSAEVLVVAVDYYGAQSVKFFYPTANTLPATLFGGSILSSQPYTISSGADSREILLVQTSQGYETRDIAVGNAGTPNNFALGNPPEPSAVAVLAVSSGNNLVIAYRDFSAISYRTISAVQSAPMAYSLQRTVLIDGSTYTATLYFWRMST